MQSYYEHQIRRLFADRNRFQGSKRYYRSQIRRHIAALRDERSGAAARFRNECSNRAKRIVGMI